MKILDGKILKETRLNELKEEISIRKKDGINPPILAVIQVGHLEESNKYVNNKNKAAEMVGIEMMHYQFEDNDVSFDNIKEKILELNKDKKVNGIFIQIPLPNEALHKRETELINLIDVDKDVDGLTTTNLGKLLTKEEGLFPCTAVGIETILDYYKIDISGKNVTIIGRSNLAGRPLSEILTNRNATVTLCHSKTNDIAMHTKFADIVISAVGKPGLITKDMVNKNAVVIDAGTTFQDGHLLGDVDFEEVSPIVSAITKVPGGVGQTTVLTLMENTLKAQKIQLKKD